MSPFFDRQSALDKRIKRIRKELSSIDSNLKSLSRRRSTPIPRARLADESGRDERTAPLSGSRNPIAWTRNGAPEGQEFGLSEEDTHARPGVDLRNERFTEYLANSFQTTRPLGREKRIQRNKAIVMAVFVLILLALILYWFLP